MDISHRAQGRIHTVPKAGECSMVNLPRISFVPTEEQVRRYKVLRKKLVDDPTLVNISDELRDKLDEILDRFCIPKTPNPLGDTI